MLSETMLFSSECFFLLPLKFSQSIYSIIHFRGLQGIKPCDFQHLPFLLTFVHSQMGVLSLQPMLAGLLSKEKL